MWSCSRGEVFVKCIAMYSLEDPGDYTEMRMVRAMRAVRMVCLGMPPPITSPQVRSCIIDSINARIQSSQLIVIDEVSLLDLVRVGSIPVNSRIPYRIPPCPDRSCPTLI